ncbi:putative L-asparaginase [Agrobacterium rubi TR3 = NBRC 13261]|uniref:Putative L-asparaginase n=1 Tax=Agrobacterium rubi TR3 = NBRC 13261 TaxID=1368415 RepID=A0A081CPM6_9HYPH|nr:asparaginase domain-containing protein [Agrobacterium rubi]MBP1877578.1 L-asparaginase [Agrobacterium rubi]MCL6654109.1 L-asparaginase [Agrobacterium rubi]GAK68622.1 putative L-asparaginase [Agrobacterium rubi TR3 = NBRC 13261]
MSIGQSTKLVAVIATGGTIASTRDETGAAKPALSGETLVSGLSGADVLIKPVELMAKDSSSLTLSDMQHISDAVAKELVDPAVSGIVILHGTDAMEESALLVHLQHQVTKPVIFTGAQFTADHPQADGPDNLAAAIDACIDPSNSEKGVLVCFGGKLLPAWGLYKHSSDARDAFDLAGKAICPQSPGLMASVKNVRVDIVAIHPGCDATHIDASLNAGVDGIVLAALGSGNANIRIVDAVSRCRDAGVPVVVSSRVPTGVLVAGYGGGGGGYDLGAAGAIHSRTLRAGQARILLAALVATAKSSDDMRTAFADFEKVAKS